MPETENDPRFAHLALIPPRELPRYDLPMQNDVAFVHHAMHMPDRILTPGALPLDRVVLRTKLIREEAVKELRRDLKKHDFINVIDAFIDTLVVSFGALVEMGVDVRRAINRQLAGILAEAYGEWPNRNDALPTAIKIGRLCTKFENRVQQTLGQALLVEGTDIPDEPVFIPELAMVTLHENELNLLGLEHAYELNNQSLQVHQLQKLIISSLWAMAQMGIDAQPFFDEIQRANLSKLDDNGQPVISRGEELDSEPVGKFLKSDRYIAPDLRRVYAERYPWATLPDVVVDDKS